MTRPYPPHKFADLFPIRADASLTDLSDSMIAHGQLEDIVLFENQVLDGRRRQSAAIRAGMVPRYREWGSRRGDGDSALEFAFNSNYHRRSLSEAERVLCAVGYATLKRGDNQHRVSGNSSDRTNVPCSQREAAKKFDVDPKKVQRAKAVTERGAPELVAAMKAETVTISDAASIVNESAEIQAQAVGLVAAGEQNTLKAAVASIRGNPPDPSAELARIGRAVTAAADALALVQVGNETARDQAVQSLRLVAACVGRLAAA